ncbi:MAG TPA: hypothetical protein VM055_06910 [Novosphingobium sp.]|nr:hypothetical protein [Novosphingobium sp.]
MKTLIAAAAALFLLPGVALAAEPEKCCCEKMKEAGKDCCADKDKDKSAHPEHGEHGEHSMEMPRN